MRYLQARAAQGDGVITDLNQRWNNGRASYRPTGELINTAAYEVAAIDDDRTARDFVVGQHYSRSYPAARFRYGLYTAGALAGVAVFSVPVNDAALDCLPGAGLERTELGRFVLRDEVPANGESWFLARCFEQLRAESLTGIMSMSDPTQRANAAGDIVFPGHVGTIYQATNATYLGRATPRTLRVLPDGTILNARAIQKARARERGWRYVVDILVKHGAAEPTTDSLVEWLAVWIPKLTRPMRHHGNHKYAWALNKRDRRHLPASLPYPKFTKGAA